jgi:hypothetical protein
MTKAHADNTWVKEPNTSVKTVMNTMEEPN